MPAKHIALDMNHDPIERKKKTVTRVKVWVEPEWMKEYRLERDRVIWLKYKSSREHLEAEGLVMTDDIIEQTIDKYNMRKI